MTLQRKPIAKHRRIVIKIGSALLVDRKSGLKKEWLDSVCGDIAALRAQDIDVLVVSFRNHALVRGKLSVDDARNQHPAAHLEEQVVLPRLELDVALAFEKQLAELHQRLLRQDDADILRDAELVLHVDHGEPMAVGGDERQTLRLEDELRAVEEVARILAGNCKLRLGNHLLQSGPRQRRPCRAAHVRERRKVFPRQRLHP